MRQLTRRLEHVCDTNDGFLGIDNSEVDNRIDAHRNVVPGNDILCRHVENHDSQIHLGHFLQARDQYDQPRTFDRLESAKKEYYAAFVLLQDLDRVVEYDDDQNGEETDCR